MADLGEYGSLLQLGVGIGIGLSIFKAPMEWLEAKLEHDLASEFDVVKNAETDTARKARADLADLRVDLANADRQLNRFNVPFLIAAILGAGVNWGLLVLASTSAGYPLSCSQELLLAGVSGPFYLLIYSILAAWAWLKLKPYRSRLDEVRSRVR